MTCSVEFNLKRNLIEIFVFFHSRINFLCHENLVCALQGTRVVGTALSKIKYLESNFPQELFALFGMITIPFDILLPFVITCFTDKRRPLLLFSKCMAPLYGGGYVYS